MVKTYIQPRSLALVSILVAVISLAAGWLPAMADSTPQAGPEAEKAMADDSKNGKLAPEAGSPQMQDDERPQPEPEVAGPEQRDYPGVANRLLRRGGDGFPSISIYYPVLGNARVDGELKNFAEDQASAYEKDVLAAIEPEGEKPANYGMWELNGFFSLERPNPNVVSITFNIFSYNGGAHGNLVIQCMNYDISTGKPLAFSDLFSDQQKALELLGEITSSRLTQELGEDADEEMIRQGTSPDADNFQNLSLAPDGLAVEFQPYQVGPWSIGPQEVFIKISELAAAGPNPEIWPENQMPVSPREDRQDAEGADPVGL